MQIIGSVHVLIRWTWQDALNSNLVQRNSGWPDLLVTPRSLAHRTLPLQRAPELATHAARLTFVLGWISV